MSLEVTCKHAVVTVGSPGFDVSVDFHWIAESVKNETDVELKPRSQIYLQLYRSTPSPRLFEFAPLDALRQESIGGSISRTNTA